MSLGQDIYGATVKPFILDVDVTKFSALVVGSDADHVALPAGANDEKFVGYALEDGKAGDTIAVHMNGGGAFARAAAAINPGKLLQIADNTGRVQEAAPAAGANAFLCGKAMGAAANAGDVIPVIPVHGVKQG